MDIKGEEGVSIGQYFSHNLQLSVNEIGGSVIYAIAWVSARLGYYMYKGHIVMTWNASSFLYYIKVGTRMGIKSSAYFL